MLGALPQALFSGPTLWAGLVTVELNRSSSPFLKNTHPDPSSSPRQQANEARQATRQLVAQSSRLREEAFDMRMVRQLDRLADRLALEKKTVLRESRVLLDGLLDIALQAAQKTRGDVQLLDRAGSAVWIAAARNLPADFTAYFGERSHQPSLRAGKAALTVVVVEDVTSELVHLGRTALEVLLATGLRAMVSVPMVCAREGWCGWISIFDAKMVAPTEDALSMLHALERQLPAFLARETQEIKQ